ncbi:uncharacterized protein ACO6RY_14100 [Pungitius sinensis]
MSAVNNCVPGNVTASCPAPSSPGLAVGLTIFFVLLLIAAGVIVYKYHSKMRSMFQFGQRRSHKKQDYTETPEDSNHYHSGISELSTGQNPIYENLATLTTRHNRPAMNKSLHEPEEDVYLQCDSPDDAIYSNDPACNLSILPDSNEEDVYIMPDSF